MNQTAAVPEEKPSAPIVNLREELDRALDALTPKCRKWLQSLPEYNWHEWGAANALGFSAHTVHRWKRDPKVAFARQLLEEAAREDYGITRRYVTLAYKRIVDGDVRKLFDAQGKAKEIQQIDDDTAFSVSEVSFDSKGRPRFKIADKRFAIEALDRMTGGTGQTQRHEHTGKDGAPLAPQGVDPIEVAKRLAFLLTRGMTAQADAG